MEVIPLTLQNHFAFKGCFNPAMIHHGTGYTLVCRLQNHPLEGYLGCAQLDSEFQLMGQPILLPLPSFLPAELGLMLEDPRIFMVDGEKYINYVVTSSGYFYLICTVLGKIVGGEIVENLVIDDKKNRRAFDRMLTLGKGERNTVLPQRGWLVEKNWQFFSKHEKWYAIYQPGEVNRVIQFDIKTGARIRTFTTYYRPLWRFGSMSGGASPVFWEGKYFSFFHSWTVWERHRDDIDFTKRRYHIGVYVFDSEPPFSIRYISRAPLYTAPEDDDFFPAGHAVIFPGSASYLPEKDEWVLACGKNDFTSVVIKIAGAEVRESLIKTTRISVGNFYVGKTFQRIKRKVTSLRDRLKPGRDGK